MNLRVEKTYSVYCSHRAWSLIHFITAQKMLFLYEVCILSKCSFCEDIPLRFPGYRVVWLIKGIIVSKVLEAVCVLNQ